MAVALDTLRTEIDAAEKAVRIADQRAANTGRALRANWRSKGPMIMGAAGAALLLRQVLRARRKVPRDRVRGQGVGGVVPGLRALCLGARSAGGDCSKCAGGCGHGEECEESAGECRARRSRPFRR